MAYTLNYLYTNQAYTVTGYTGTPDNVVIPNTYNDGAHGEFPVMSIGNSAFSGCSSLTSITIPDSVTSIGSSAFKYCSSLTSIIFGENSELESIGNSAFSGCSSLTSITIPDSVTSIGYAAFHNCSSLTSITIPDSVISIGSEAFYDCSRLTSITIPNSVASIGRGTFSRCSILTNIILLPNTPPTLGTDAFRYVSANTKFYCRKSSENAYKTATNWNTYADKIIGDDIALYFGMNANSTKDYIDRKTIAGISLQDGISKQELADALGVGDYPTITVVVAQIIGVGNDAYTTAQYIRFTPTQEQAAILANNDYTIIKLDLTALGNSAPAPYVWLRRNTVIALPNPLDPSSTIPAYQFTCGGEQFWYDNYQTDVTIKNIGNGALVYIPQLILDASLTPYGVADITLLNVSIPDLYYTIGNKQDKLTFDSTPTAGSTNPVTSEGIKLALETIQHYTQIESVTLNTAVSAFESSSVLGYNRFIITVAYPAALGINSTIEAGFKYENESAISGGFDSSFDARNKVAIYTIDKMGDLIFRKFNAGNYDNLTTALFQAPTLVISNKNIAKLTLLTTHTFSVGTVITVYGGKF